MVDDVTLKTGKCHFENRQIVRIELYPGRKEIKQADLRATLLRGQ
jgi:hypothetical protein